MPELKAAEVAQLAVQMRLLTPAQWEEFKDSEGEFETGHDLVRAFERKGITTPYLSNKLLKGDKDGYFLGQYKLLYKVGSGSYGRVFRAEDPQTGSMVAIKVLRQRHNDNTHVVEMFQREAKVGLALRHENIVQILYLGQDPPTQQHFFVMEFVEGGNLRDFLSIRKKLEPAEALRLIEDAAAALAHAHSKGVTHRDMKLSNILISSNGRAKLVDFGLAGKAMLPGRGDDQADRSVDYAGLEMATNVPPGDVRSDIYFMGCVLYEILTGKSPLKMSKSKQDRMARERFEKVPPITRQDVDAPHSVFQLVETMMSLNPIRRYQTPTQLVGAIRAARADIDSNQAHKAAVAAGTPVAAAPAECTVFVVEKNERMQEKLRESLKKAGYRMLLSINPENALNRYRQKPYQALIMDIETVGEDALHDAKTILAEAERHKQDVAAILIFGESQKHLAQRLEPQPRVEVMVLPFKSHHLLSKLQQLVPAPANPNGAAGTPEA